MHPELFCRQTNVQSTRSVPQVSVLSLLEFATYTDVPDVIHINQLKRHMYAGDTWLIRPPCITRIQFTIVHV